ncbi:FAD dependent oxidoreductase [Dipodascopsis tothii]|uniref:FAD dependent oxidoreductase n=1 Tax=Dipodascopsis tothii TaxID=44089 RepID=UPI0034CDAF22
MAVPAKSADIVVVGAGVFGLSTAYYLAQDGFEHVTVLDRARPPVLGGSSVDISRIVRADYSDIVYAKMCVEAIELWKTEFRDHFHQSGILCMNPVGNTKYWAEALASVQSLAQNVELTDGAGARQQFGLGPGALADQAGYLNKDAGWADAEEAMRQLYGMCLAAGVSFVTGAEGTVTGFAYRPGTAEIVAVETAGGPRPTDFVVLAAGAWTDSLFDMKTRTVATGQPVGFVQLTPEEQVRFRGLPVYINFVTGYYSFPPHPRTGEIKFARHSHGYTNYQPTATSRLSSTPAAADASASARTLPADADACLRQGLADLLGPDLARRAYSRTRICWYNDTPLKDFIFGYSPDAANLFVATGGSGHAFKFLPVLGKYAVGCLTRTLPAALLAKFAVPGPDVVAKLDASRGGTPLMDLAAALA